MIIEMSQPLVLLDLSHYYCIEEHTYVPKLSSTGTATATYPVVAALVACSLT